MRWMRITYLETFEVIDIVGGVASRKALEDYISKLCGNKENIPLAEIWSNIMCSVKRKPQQLIQKYTKMKKSMVKA
jgi:hypothetical protein